MIVSWSLVQVLLPAEALPQRFRPEGKDALDVPPDKQAVHNEVEPYRVTHVIAHERAAVSLLERMLVYPEPVRSKYLFIDEPPWRLPHFNFCPPAHRDAVDAQLVIDDRALTHRNGSLRHSSKLQPGRCNRVQVGSVRKESEQLILRLREPLLRKKFSDLHCLPTPLESFGSTGRPTPLPDRSTRATAERACGPVVHRKIVLRVEVGI